MLVGFKKMTYNRCQGHIRCHSTSDEGQIITCNGMHKINEHIRDRKTIGACVFSVCQGNRWDWTFARLALLILVRVWLSSTPYQRTKDDGWHEHVAKSAAANTLASTPVPNASEVQLVSAVMKTDTGVDS